ncbi:PREDICTED: uncharacterized protein LOC109166765 [Ipomoea nil]|uniref:uncharacterized protein LOC109166765 n=1 Tax=Ipomoea nil TaxID=35883 RepID=UPI000901494F|nr:PREDICTED: uncharacterized protein LOC109166765 [Ipomoea nil]
MDPAQEEDPVEVPEREWAPRRPGPEGNLHQQADFYPRYKADFPAFDYEHPRNWIVRCERFFMFSHTPRNEVMNLLFVNLSGKVGLWYEGYVSELRQGFQWHHFAEAVCKRFENKGESLMEEFASLKQWGTVEDFTEKYEEFKSQLLVGHPYLTEGYFMENFVARLKPNLRCFVRTAKPTTLSDAIWYAGQFERGLKTSEPNRSIPWNSRQTPPTKTHPTEPLNPPHNKKPALSSQYANSPSPELTRFKAQLREQRRCFKCFESWKPGHKCKGPTFHLIEEDEGYDQDYVEQAEPETNKEEAEVSLCAMVVGEGMHTIKLLGFVQRQKILILVDSGSTHSFLDPKLLSQLRKDPVKASPLTVTIANGEQVRSDSVCLGLNWEVQGEEFTKDFRLLNLRGCDMVLGMDWIDLYALIQLHTRPPSLSFHKDERKIILKGLTKAIMLKAASGKQIRRWHQKGIRGFLVQPNIVPHDTPPTHTIFHHYEPHLFLTLPHTPFLELTLLLQEFQDVFAEPTDLPPPRVLDHSIPLVPGAKPVNMGPYRYSYDQKNAIEKMVNEMLEAGVITPSTSSFASPVLLVPKKDNNWRFCIDYRALNNITIKNKFPIPLVEDLFSELAGVGCFSKLDLRSRYHQVRMKE